MQTLEMRCRLRCVVYSILFECLLHKCSPPWKNTHILKVYSHCFPILLTIMAIWRSPSPIHTLFFYSFLSFNFHFYYGSSFLIYEPLIYPSASPASLQSHIPLLLHLLLYLLPAGPASEPASSAQSTMAGPFCSRSHALLISLSFSMAGNRQKVRGALCCRSVNQGPCLKLHKLLVKQAVWWTLRAGLHCDTSISTEPIGILAKEKLTDHLGKQVLHTWCFVNGDS